MKSQQPPYAVLKLFAIVAIIVSCASASAIGIIIPKKPDLAPPILSEVSVDTTIKDHIARSRITQIFKNPNAQPVEADFYFPVPDGADITDFVLYMNGKPVRGEVLDKSKAHDIYRDIVRRMRDPGLIEWSEKNLFRVRIFPIPANGEQKLEIELSQALPADQGYYRYLLPLRSGRHPAEQAPPDFSINIRLEGSTPVRNVYSPTHTIDTNTSDPKTVTVSLKGETLAARENFILFYETSEKDVAVGLLAHRITGTPGYFSLRISPPWDEQATTSQPADYIFVIDSSGSMTADDKMEQARKALQYCINVLNPQDRFNLVRFSTTVEQFQPKLQYATPANVKSGNEWIENIQARGGTNIHDALESALSLAKDTSATTGASSRLATIVFLTDGLPTVGQTSPEKITKTVEELAGADVRIFTFGLGNDVNTRLLDTIADKSKAASAYIAPETDLEVPISRFFDKVSRPALVDVKLSVPGAGVTEVYPPNLPDLFYGTEVSVFGQYKQPGESAIILTGTIDGVQKEFRFEKTFPEVEKDNQFVEKLWATRKVAWLLDQVRMSGESEELKTEITDLASKYAIVTPYTSYLAIEDQKNEDSHVHITGPSAPFYPHLPQARPAAIPAQESRVAAGFSSNVALQSESGAMAVNTARRINTMKSADVVHQQLPEQPQTRVVGSKTFHLENGIWTDTAITGNETKTVRIKHFSDAWFHLADNFSDLRTFFELGENVRVRLSNGIVLETGTDGIENAALIDYTSLGLKHPAEK